MNRTQEEDAMNQTQEKDAMNRVSTRGDGVVVRDRFPN
ncbi:hypothetical protein NSTC731_04368 [Nostoc sp. DSM 114167]